ncbi:MAG: Microtubule-nucleating Tub4p (gamma-tubulin) complex component [Caeruleum heppii]|nr:MAG: Microtubule-nucleating Tub4p (gamma-tubulin) complex component [Caeruleum heppii]
MSGPQSRRIDDALSSLVDAFIPGAPHEDDQEVDARRDDALDLAKSILDSSNAPPVIDDVNHASDLIKRKLIRVNSSPDKALRYSNLYSRLLTQPVLSQRWATLYLLYQLADSPDPSSVDAASLSSYAAGEHLSKAQTAAADRRSHGKTNASAARDDTDPMLSGAFSQQGLHRLPARHDTQDSHQGLYADQDQSADGAEGVPNASAPMSSIPENKPASHPSEAMLLRDLPFTLQGLSSTILAFQPTGSLKLPDTLPSPIISLLHALAEPSLLYRGLSAFVQTSDGDLVEQSLKAAIGDELRSYLGLVATLEGEIRRALAMLQDESGHIGLGKAGVTLKRCVIWTREATMGLRLLSMMVEESKSKKGGQLISLIHSFSSSHGDPFVGAFAERLLSHVTRPFYDMLRQWIYDGELQDPHHEFFVSEQDPTAVMENSAEDRIRGGATSVWEDKYNLAEDMVPSIITTDFAKKVFLIGKSLNFIRYGCGDSAWVEAYSKDASKELRYGDTDMLEASIDEAYKTTMARLMHLMSSKFHLFEHLTALKKYLLLGQGDFIALLMESLSSNLDRPANTLYRHSLTAQLEHAIRGSNAQYDAADVLRRLDARMLMQGHGEIGWDVFTLEYKIDAPIDVIVTPEGSRQYLKVFNFLWRIKRVEFALGSTWRRSMTGARGVLAAVGDRVGKDWKHARCAIAEMIHFVCQLQYYILFEVIESSWDALQLAISKPEATLDDLITAHATYLQAITHKGLLGGSARGGGSATGNKEDSFLAQLHGILKVMLAYKDAVDGLYSFSVAEFTRRQDFSARIERRTAEGKWGLTEADEEDLRSPSPATRKPHGDDSTIHAAASAAHANEDTLPPLRVRLQTLSSEFRQKVNTLLGDLAYQPDVDMRFLGVVMNFNDVYEPVRRRRAKDGRGTGKDRETERERDGKKTPGGT